MDSFTGQSLYAALAKLDAWAAGTRAQATAAADEIATLLESYAKTHHLWTPRTGNTDTSTRGFVSEVTDDLITIVLTAGMEYDVFLELARGGKWAWLWPAIVENQDAIRAILQKRLGGGVVETIGQ